MFEWNWHNDVPEHDNGSWKSFVGLSTQLNGKCSFLVFEHNCESSVKSGSHGQDLLE